MCSYIAAFIFWLSIATIQSEAFVPPSPRKHITMIHHTSKSTRTSLPSLVSDSSDYKADEIDTDDDLNSSDVSRIDDDDMANAPTTEEFPVPMSRNNVGSRWICVVLDRELYKGYDGKVWEGESSAPPVPVGEFDEDDEMADEDVDVQEEDYEEEEEEETVESDIDMDIRAPEFKEVPMKPSAFEFQPLELQERLTQDTIHDEYDNDHILWKMHNERIALTEQHVMWARKQNLYNESFNTESMADILWSHQILSSDLQRAIGHVMCIDSPTLEHCREALSRDPIIRKLVGVDPKTDTCDVSSVPLYRWRHIRDHTLRRDDGRNGFPNMLLAFDHPEATEDGVREANYNKHLEYMIRSERIIAAGPLHVATEEKTDPKSVPVGTLMLFNAKNRDHAVEFVENDPFALEGLYDTMTVSGYNKLDVTGKFVQGNMWYPEDETSQMKEAMEVWGYPVDDDQTKWLNW